MFAMNVGVDAQNLSNIKKERITAQKGSGVGTTAQKGRRIGITARTGSGVGITARNGSGAGITAQVGSRVNAWTAYPPSHTKVSFARK